MKVAKVKNENERTEKTSVSKFSKSSGQPINQPKSKPGQIENDHYSKHKNHGKENLVCKRSLELIKNDKSPPIKVH